MQFVDNIKLFLKAGDGGNGMLSWRKEAHVGEGGPWGGDGGKGGDIILVGDSNESTLFKLKNKKQIIAENGGNGGNQLMTGKNGENIYIKIPLGTVIYNENNKKIGEVINNGEKIILCSGGQGGHGNAYFKSSINRIPSIYENGDIGESMNVTLEIKHIADVGIVGLPNAGKSTLINSISNVESKVGNYQFTTITPILGVVEFNKNRLIFADIPGLIEGANEGKGLGHDFLKHIERCKVLIHLISLEKDDTLDIVNDYLVIINELKKYKNILSKKKIILVGNKIDGNWKENYEILKKKIKSNFITVSGMNKINIDILLKETFSFFKKKKAIKTTKTTKIYKKENNNKNVYELVKIDEHTWEVKSEYLNYWTHKIPFKTNDNIIRFNQKISNIGVEEKAKKMGAQKGDTLLINGHEFNID